MSHRKTLRQLAARQNSGPMHGEAPVASVATTEQAESPVVPVTSAEQVEDQTTPDSPSDEVNLAPSWDGPIHKLKRWVK